MYIILIISSDVNPDGLGSGVRALVIPTEVEESRMAFIRLRGDLSIRLGGLEMTAA